MQAVAAVPAVPFLRAIVVPKLERPMPATSKDLDRLRDLLAWSEDESRDKTERLNRMQHTLRMAITTMETRHQHTSVLWWILGALLSATRRNFRGDWIVSDRALLCWALDQLEERLGGGLSQDSQA